MKISTDFSDIKSNLGETGDGSCLCLDDDRYKHFKIAFNCGYMIANATAKTYKIRNVKVP